MIIITIIIATMIIDEIITEADPPFRIKNIGEYVELNNRDGASVGQGLTVSYIFLKAALEYSNVTVPFVVDSPVGSLDHVHKKGLGEILPKISDQFITFIQPSERDVFVDHAVQAAEEKCSFTTIFWKTELNTKWLENQNVDQRDLLIRSDYGMVNGYRHMQDYTLVKDLNLDIKEGVPTFV